MRKRWERDEMDVRKVRSGKGERSTKKKRDRYMRSERGIQGRVERGT